MSRFQSLTKGSSAGPEIFRKAFFKAFPEPQLCSLKNAKYGCGKDYKKIWKNIGFGAQYFGERLKSGQIEKGLERSRNTALLISLQSETKDITLVKKKKKKPRKKITRSKTAFFFLGRKGISTTQEIPSIIHFIFKSVYCRKCCCECKT